MVPAEQVGKMKKMYAQVIDTYGGKRKCKILGIRVQQELDIFRAAVTMVNNTCDPTIIHSDVQLLDVICQANPRIGKIIQDSSSYSVCNKSKNEDYLNQIWTIYTKQGGNFNLVVYGLIEYLCRMYDPTCDYVQTYLQKFTSDSALRTVCLSCKIDL
jgi:hypothetical protein